MFNRVELIHKVQSGGYTVVRFVANNPGVWMLHCHMDFHAEVGMGMLLKVGQDSDLPPQPSGWTQCRRDTLNTKLSIQSPYSTTSGNLKLKLSYLNLNVAIFYSFFHPILFY
jgi:hypothetical protein